MNITRIVITNLSFLLVLASTVRAKDEGFSVLWKLDSFELGYLKAQAAYLVDLDHLPDTPDGHKEEKESWEQFQAKATKLFAEALKLAEANSDSEDGYAALEWILKHEDAFFLPVGVPSLKLINE